MHRLRPSLTSILSISVLSLLMAAPPTLANEWADGVPYTTDWETAIRKSKETGKILFIYSGWQKAGA